jgi:type IV pilus assembly protein PilB
VVVAAPTAQETVSLATEVLAEFLASARAFAGVDAAVVTKVAPHFEGKRFAAGSHILRAGAPASFGILYSGRASTRLINAVSGEATVAHELRVGEHFGEIATLLESAQPHEVVAEGECVVLLMSASAFKWLVARAAPFNQALAKTLATRLLRAQMTAVGTSARPSRPPDARRPDTGPPPRPAELRPAELRPAASNGVIPFYRTSDFDVNDQLVAHVPVESILAHRFLPLALEGNTLTVGMVDPYQGAAIAELGRVLRGIEVQVAGIGYDDYMAVLARLRLDAGPRRHGAQLSAEAIAYEKDDQEREAEHGLGVIGNEVVGLVDKICKSAIAQGASDIHVEEQRTGVRVRLRVNGLLRDSSEYIPTSLARGLVARIKVLAGLDITERRRPQDGRIGLRVGRREVDLRISTLPTRSGEKVVMRVFEAANMLRPLEQIFLDKGTLETMRDALNRPYGAVLVAGATGSGKSSTLYACLHERKTSRPDTNICLVEDPIEYRLEGVTQVQVNDAVELTFAKVLRAFLRQDPDVIMVGEMRDAETARIALEAAMTGHLVFSSFHANDVPAALQRLENLGCNRTMIAQSVALVIVQRLVRRLCAHCAVLADPPRALLGSLVERGLVVEGTSIQVPRARGCDRCDHTGYSGRVAVMESLKVNEAVAAALMSDERLDEIEKAAERDGLMVPFRRSAAALMARKIIAPGDALLAVAG